MKKLWRNGTILSLKNSGEYDWILTEEDRILDMGGKEDEPHLTNTATIHDLEGLVLMPSFIDAHGHFSANIYSFIQVDLSECGDFQDIRHKIKAYIQQNDIEENK